MELRQQLAVRKLECVYDRMARRVLAAMALLDNSRCMKLLKRHQVRCDNVDEPLELNVNEPPAPLDSNEVCDDVEPDIVQPLMANDNASTTQQLDEHDRASSNAKRRALKLFSHFPYHSRLALLCHQQRSLH